MISNFGGYMMLLDGCHEGKHTPRLAEVKCPKCGEVTAKFRFNSAPLSIALPKAAMVKS